MYGELAPIRETVDLSEREALDSAETFLTQLGYRPMQRTDNSLTVERRTPSDVSEGSVLNLTVLAMPQPEGGVQIKVRGNDRERVEERQAQWIEWSESLPKNVMGTDAGDQPDQDESLPVPAEPAAPMEVPDETQMASDRSGTQSAGDNVIFDKQDQLDKIAAGLIPGEQLEAVFHLKGGGTGFVGITSKRVIFQDNSWVMNTKAIVSVPYSRIHTEAAEDAVGLFTGRGYFSSSRIMITTSEGARSFQFRGADKAHIAHDLILKHMV
jgi:hypothetical protein